jgi:hypothetical protein
VQIVSGQETTTFRGFVDARREGFSERTKQASSLQASERKQLSLTAIGHHSHVHFTNKTAADVKFVRNGGAGLTTHLPAGQHASFNMVVDTGVVLSVGIFQPSGPRLYFSLQAHVNYAFIQQNGHVVNAFA